MPTFIDVKARELSSNSKIEFIKYTEHNVSATVHRQVPFTFVFSYSYCLRVICLLINAVELQMFWFTFIAFSVQHHLSPKYVYIPSTSYNKTNEMY